MMDTIRLYKQESRAKTIQKRRIKELIVNILLFIQNDRCDVNTLRRKYIVVKSSCKSIA